MSTINLIYSKLIGNGFTRFPKESNYNYYTCLADNDDRIKDKLFNCLNENWINVDDKFFKDPNGSKIKMDVTYGTDKHDKVSMNIAINEDVRIATFEFENLNKDHNKNIITNKLSLKSNFIK